MADVLIVGYGPVGQVTANLLAQRGWRIVVVERHPAPYPMPRAVAFDGEAARILAAAGVGGRIAEFGEPSGDYLWRNADGEELIYIGAPGVEGRNGWPDSISMYQPGLEAALTAHGAEQPGLRVVRGADVVELGEVGDSVEAVAVDRDGHRLRITARCAIGCDGANSMVRRHIGTEMVDLGFCHDWLICDVVLREDRAFVPNNLQICDPARPRTEVSAGPGHRRWEFMLLPGEDRHTMDTPEQAWRLLGTMGVTPETAVMERHAVYTFEASYARQWRAGRLLIAGDAAHLMPPFAGQGMSSGFRDAANLSWKLDAVLRGWADDGLLDTYTTERRAHVQHAIKMSMDLGKVICQTDARAAADRDTVMTAMRRRQVSRPEPPPFQSLLAGPLTRAPGGGDLTPQPRVVAADGRTGRLDEIVGGDEILLVATADPAAVLTGEQLDFLAGVGAVLVHLGAEDAEHRETASGVARHLGAATYRLNDPDGAYRTFLADRHLLGVIVRPDHYVFAGASDVAGLRDAVDELRACLSATRGVPQR
ncbi:bifunctional 3-(3-hydroxy-phenyl)propionate/3-hydroxycinnamic acid hydroxylase [Micromonospora sp. DT31]|uniref:bifunctional 3-(3-hydroxy-phenyl)propionate/3-hydroxycinnamic acid hydroxylase MhpA n=1 Tax=Micromonospora sp. DT31 TaxID=3393434 RepID=UPI003CF23186